MLDTKFCMRCYRTWFTKNPTSSTSSLSTPLNKAPMLSLPHRYLKVFKHFYASTDFSISYPYYFNSSPTFIIPDLIPPVTNGIRPDIEKTSYRHQERFIFWSGWGMVSSTAFINSIIAFLPVASSFPSTAFNAEPFTIGILSPGNL